MNVDTDNAKSQVHTPKELLLDAPFLYPELFSANLVLFGNDYHNITLSSLYNSLGKQIKAVLTNEYNLPNKIDTSLTINATVFEKLSLNKYLLKFAALNNWDIANWNTGNNNFKSLDPNMRFYNKTSPLCCHYINLHNIDPSSLLAAFVMALKENAQYLDIDTTKLELNLAEQTPAIARQISLYKRLDRSRGSER